MGLCQEKKCTDLYGFLLNVLIIKPIFFIDESLKKHSIPVVRSDLQSDLIEPADLQSAS